MNFTCPVCGYAGLDEEPNDSFEICPCCGVEFGFDDGGFDQGTPKLALRQKQLRAAWLLRGADWMDESRKPRDWDANEQLRAAGLSVPAPGNRVTLAMALPERLRQKHRVEIDLLEGFESASKPKRRVSKTPARKKATKPVQKRSRARAK